MKILFLSHSYSIETGGIENHNRDLTQGLSKLAEIKVIANERRKKFLPIFIPWAFLRCLFLMPKYDVCLVGSGILAPIPAALKFFYPRKKFFSVIHGLDVTYIKRKHLLSRLYELVNIPSLRKMDKIFSVSMQTIEEAVAVGVDRKKIVFAPNGVHIDKIKEPHTREELSKLFGKSVKDKKVLLRLGRFIPHKGILWFIENVMPHLDENVVLIATGYRVAKNTVGDPDIFPDCEKAILRLNLQNRVKLLPCLPQADLRVLLNTADLFISPNVRYPGSMEGFGVNVIEAGACGRVVLAADLEGLAQAIKDGENGFLVEPENVEKWVKKINIILDAKPDFFERFGKKAEKYTREHYSWDKICKKYLEEMED